MDHRQNKALTLLPFAWAGSPRNRLYKRHLPGLLALLLLAGAALPGAASAQHAAADPATARAMREALALAERQPQQALRIVTDLLREHPAFVPAIKLQGMILEDAGNSAAAAQAYARALQLAPSDPDLLLKVGVISLVQGDAARAIVLLGQHAKALPRDEEGFYYLAQAYHRRGDNDLALQAIRKASALAPASAPIQQKYGELLCSSGDNVEALRVLLKAQHADPSLARIHFDLAVASYNNLDLDQAVTYATQQTEAQPADLDAFALLAAAEGKLSQWSAAQPAIEHVLAARPDDPSLLMQLGHCQLELHQEAAAVDTLHRALVADPTQPLAHFLLSRAYAALGKTDEARHEAALHQRMMQEVSFEVPKAQQLQQAQRTEQARKLLTANRENEAVQLFAKEGTGLSSSPGSPYIAVGATYLSMGNTEAAERILHRALQIDPKAKGAHSYLGILALEQGDLNAAEGAFNAELNGDPNHPLALAELGEVRYRQSRWSDAIDFFVRSKTSFPRFLYMLTDAYFHAGNVTAADLTAESMAAFARKEPDILDHLTDLLNRNGQTDLARRLQHP